jgi:hypothetical protein
MPFWRKRSITSAGADGPSWRSVASPRARPASSAAENSTPPAPTASR